MSNQDEGIQGNKTLFCIECEDVPAAVICEDCNNEAYCGLCFRYLHKKGTRAKHKYHLLPGVILKEHIEPNRSGMPTNQNDGIHIESELDNDIIMTSTTTSKSSSKSMNIEHTLADVLSSNNIDNDDNDDNDNNDDSNNTIDKKEDCDGDTEMEDTTTTTSKDTFSTTSSKDTLYPTEVKKELLEYAKWIPLRITSEERTLLNMLEGLLEVSQYTDHVDVSFDYYGYRTSGGDKKTNIINKELSEVLDLICGLSIVGDYKHNVGIINKTYQQNEKFYQKVFEIGRRFKILNPSKMRTTYGKLMHILQDYQFNATIIKDPKISPIRTVLSLLKSKNALLLLADPDLKDAIRTITTSNNINIEKQNENNLIKNNSINSSSSSSSSDSSSLSSSFDDRAKIDALIARKRRLQEELSRKYSSQCLKSSTATVEDIQLCLDSLSDADAYLVSNRDPVEKTLKYLEKYFSPSKPKDKIDDLSISVGLGGSCLSHSHSQQFEFVRQSLLLWKEIQSQMFKLWILADYDLLEAGGPYRLCSNGQGLNRLQAAPNVGKAMHQILSKVQSSIGKSWLGLSVVHLGDRDVPNALFFIDKYSQVPRILGPLVNAVERLDDLNDDPRIRMFVDKCGKLEYSKKFIMKDFFRHAFDGSGSDGGSCIDGRLTSSWNWCSKLYKKQYYPLFLATGFQGFDGEF